MLSRVTRGAAWCCVVTLLAATVVNAAEPVKRIGVYVQPFYDSARTGNEAPRVVVGKRYDALLASSKREDILTARDIVKAEPKVVTPMVMMVLALRLYDVGERDEAVFWFYVAKDRMMILTEVATPNAGQLAQALEAVKAFSSLAGPDINGYAFCDLGNQQAIRARALDWVEANPYEVMFMSQLPVRGADRRALAAAGLRLARDNAAKERGYSKTPKTATASMPAAKPTRWTRNTAGADRVVSREICYTRSVGGLSCGRGFLS